MATALPARVMLLGAGPVAPARLVTSTFAPSSLVRALAASTPSRLSRARPPPIRASMTSAEPSSAPPARRVARVAVVGAGAAGLAAARELKAEGPAVVVFEQARDVGGVWVYDPSVESDPLGRDDRRHRVHSSMYRSLRTNLPREVMGYESFPFTRVFGGDDRRFCGHAEVRAYLAAYAEHHDLAPLVRLGARVVAARPKFDDDADVDVERWGPRWEVISSNPTNLENTVAETYDAVVVCNGHYSEPRTPEFPGAEDWPGEQTHSHNYRDPEAFRGKTVVVLGAMASGEDLSREIAGVAKEVILAARGYAPNPDPDAGDFPASSYPANFTRAPGVTALEREHSAVRFEDGSVRQHVDVMLYATGYHYDFPFLREDAAGVDEDAGVSNSNPSSSSLHCVSAEDNAVGPLYEHVFPPSVAPSLSFVGLPWKVVPFPQFELQSRWIARALSRGRLPSRDAMAEAAAEEEKARIDAGIATRHAHRMGDAQWAYNDRVAAACGDETLAGWRERMYKATGARKRSAPTAYRDGPLPWTDEDAREEAREEARARGFEVDQARDEWYHPNGVNRLV